MSQQHVQRVPGHRPRPLVSGEPYTGIVPLACRAHLRKAFFFRQFPWKPVVMWKTTATNGCWALLAMEAEIQGIRHTFRERSGAHDHGDSYWLGSRPRLFALRDGAYVPGKDGRLVAARKERPAVGQQRECVHLAAVAGELAEFLACGEVPEADRIVPARRGKRPAVGREGQACDRLVVAAQAAALLAGGKVENLNDGFQSTGDGQEFPVWREAGSGSPDIVWGGGCDIAVELRPAVEGRLQLAHLLACCGVPDADLFAAANPLRADQNLAVRGEGQRFHLSA